MAELPTLDDIEIDLDDNIDLEISVFARMESTVHKKARPSDEMKTRVAQNGALFLDAGTSEDKATVIDNPSPSNQDTDTVHNKCTFSAKQYFGIYFWFFSITFFISDKRLPLFDFPFCNPNSDFLFFNLITVFLKGILPVNFSL